MRLIMQSLKKYRFKCLLLILATTLQAASQMFIIGYVSNSVNTIMDFTGGSYDYSAIKLILVKTGVVLFACAVLMAVFSIVAGYFSSGISSGVGSDLRERLFGKVMDLSAKQINDYSISSLITRTTDDTQQIQTTLFMILSMSLSAPLMAIFGLVGALRYKSKLEWIILASIIAVVLSMLVIFKLAYPYVIKLNVKLDEVNMVSREGLTGLQVIRAFGKEKWLQDRCRKANEEYKEVATYSRIYIQMMVPFFTIITNLASVLIVWLGAKKVMAGLIEVGVVVELISYVQLIVLGFMIIAAIGMQIPRMVTTAKRLDVILNTDPDIEDGNICVKDIKNHDELRLENVSFRYSEDGGNVLEDISFSAKKGEMTAIIGNTGSGKTTILRLLSRLYDATCGTVRVWGEDIRNLKIDDYLETVGYVPQSSYLFSGTIESNIKTGKKTASEKEVLEAAEFSQADGFIKTHENGYKGIVTHGGNNLSGGQRQRMAVARAAIKKPEIYLLDDCFSALDNMTVKNLKKELIGRKSDSVMIVVAQRISTVMNADKIIVMEGGRIVGEGTHEELITKCEVYREIARSQMPEQEFSEAGKGQA